MKRIFMFLLIVAMLSASYPAQAEITPDWFLLKNGIIILDEKAMMGEDFDTSKIQDVLDISLCLFTYNVEQYGNLIFWIKDGHMNCGVDLSALWMDGTKQKNYTMRDTFVEFCYTFPFDVYAFGDMNDIFLLGSDEGIKKIHNLMRNTNTRFHDYKDHKQFFAELENRTSGF